MTFNDLNGTLLGDNLAYIFIYANEVTRGWFVPLMVLAFFIVVFLSSLFMQLRITGRIKPETSFLAASFVTFGFGVLLLQKSGLFSWTYFVILLVMTIIGVIWVVWSEKY